MANINIDLLISIVLIIIMFGIGVSLTIKDAKEVFSNPKPLIVGLSSQMILLPIIAFGISILFNIPSYIQLGLIILAASPGGTTSGFITYLFKGNTALSIVLTSINSVLILFSIPFIINFALGYFLGETTDFQLPIFETIKEIFILTAIPAATGIVISYYFPQLAKTINKVAKPISTLLLGIVFTLKFIGNEGDAITKNEVFEILPYALLLNILCFLCGLIISKSFKLGLKNHLTISIESAVHNTTIAFLVAGNLLNKPEFGKVALVYAMFSFWTALIFSFLLIRLSKRT